MRREPGYTAFVVAIAGLGIGASATVFSVVNTLLLQPLPFEQPSELVWIANRDTPGLSGQTTQVGYMLDLRERSQTMAAVAAICASVQIQPIAPKGSSARGTAMMAANGG